MPPASHGHKANSTHNSRAKTSSGMKPADHSCDVCLGTRKSSDFPPPVWTTVDFQGVVPTWTEVHIGVPFSPLDQPEDCMDIDEYGRMIPKEYLRNFSVEVRENVKPSGWTNVQNMFSGLPCEDTESPTVSPSKKKKKKKSTAKKKAETLSDSSTKISDDESAKAALSLLAQTQDPAKLAIFESTKKDFELETRLKQRVPFPTLEEVEDIDSWNQQEPPSDGYAADLEPEVISSSDDPESSDQLAVRLIPFRIAGVLSNVERRLKIDNADTVSSGHLITRSYVQRTYRRRQRISSLYERDMDPPPDGTRGDNAIVDSNEVYNPP